MPKEILTPEKPVQPKKRLILLDVFRGFAVMGVFVVNIEIMNCIFMNQEIFGQQWTGVWDKFSIRILQLFFYSKFFPIFSFLFGLGITMQAMKLAERSTLRFSFFARRMFFLFIFGVLHVLLLWSGDVIHLYAILGIFTTMILKCSNRLILLLSLFFLVFPFYDQVGEMILNLLHYEPELYLNTYTPESIVATIRNGSYLDGIVLRVREYLANVNVLFVFLAPVALSMFLLGSYFVKKGYVFCLEKVIEQLTKGAIMVAVITNAYRLLFLFVLPNQDIYSNPLAQPILFKLMFLCDIAMGLFYLWLIGFLWYNTKLGSLLSTLQYAGRMALTNYILQSAIALFLFTSSGLGWYQTLSPWQTLVAALAVFAFQAFLSWLWLQHFKYGPLEWVWRCLTYKKRLPILKKRRNILVTTSN